MVSFSSQTDHEDIFFCYIFYSRFLSSAAVDAICVKCKINEISSGDSYQTLFFFISYHENMNANKYLKNVVVFSAEIVKFGNVHYYKKGPKNEFSEADGK